MPKALLLISDERHDLSFYIHSDFACMDF